MSAELVVLNRTKRPRTADIRDRLLLMAAILKAIDAGELQSALPNCPVARGAHLAGLNLLAALETEIAALVDALEPYRDAESLGRSH